MYTPPNSIDHVTYEGIPQIRLGLIGAPGSGKTTAALTAPHPFVLDVDGGLTGHKGKPIHSLPAHSAEWIAKTSEKNAKDALYKWLEREGPKFEAGQTLIIDSWTMLQVAFDRQTEKTPVFSAKTGEEDTFKFWARKDAWSRDVCDILKSLRCHVIVTFHERIMRDSSGNATSKIEPLMPGQFADKLPAFFTDWFRQSAEQPRDATNKIIEGAPTKFRWQTQPDSIVNCKSRVPGLPKFIDADFGILLTKYNQIPSV